MTKEQIEELRRLQWPYVHPDPGGLATFGRKWVTVDDYEMVKALLPRLLDEREALLEAANEAVRDDGELAAGPLARAIAKAEAP